MAAGIESDFPAARFARAGVAAGTIATLMAEFANNSPADQAGIVAQLATQSDYQIAQITATSLPAGNGAHRGWK